jgi:hypothetical protein
VLSNDTPKPAALWLYNYVRGIAPTIKADQTFNVSDVNAPVGAVQADDWASAMGRPELRTFAWTLTGSDGPFAIVPATGELRITDQGLLDEHTTYTLKARVNDGVHSSEEVTFKVATQDLANVVDGGAGATVPATLSLTLGSNAGFGAFTPGVGKDYDAAASANVISTAGDAALSMTDAGASPGRLVNGAFALTQPVQASVSGAFAPVGATPIALHSYSGPVSNDPLTIRFKQTINGNEPLRTGAYSKSFTFTLSTTAP